MRRTHLSYQINSKQFVQSLYKSERFEDRKDTPRAIVSLLKRYGAKENMMAASGKSGFLQTPILSVLKHLEATGTAAEIIEAFKNHPSHLFRALNYCKYCPEILKVRYLKTIFNEPTERIRRPYDYVPIGEKWQEPMYLSFVKEAKEKYYTGNPIVSNYEYDVLKQIAIVLSTGETGVSESLLDFENNVPITFVGGVNTLFLNPMYGKETTFTTFPNIDGLRVSIEYENGYIKKAISLGFDMRAVINAIHNIPKNIKSMKPTTVEGVLYVSKKVFYNLNHERRIFGEPTWKDMKTGMIQVLRQQPHDLTRVFDQDLSFYADKYIQEETVFDKERERFETLKNLGFPVLDHSYFSVFKAQDGGGGKDLNDLPFFTEGMVVRLNRNDDRSLLGGGEVIHKTMSPCQTKKITDISYNTGNGKFIFPVVILQSSTRVAFESLKEIKDLDLRVGDTIIYSSQPQANILSSARNGDSPKFQPCNHCPKCGGKVVEKEGIFYCKSRSSCRSLTVEEISRFTGPQGFNITLLGHGLIAELIEKNIITTEADILNMKEESHHLLERTSKEVFDNLLQQIKNSKAGISLKNFLYALNIPLISYHVAQYLEERFGNWSALISHTGDLDIEMEAAKELRTFLKDEKELIQRFFDSGVTIVEPRESITELCSKKEYTKRHFKLIEESIKHHTENYDISDKEYDMLSQKYDELAKEHPQWIEGGGKIVHFADPLVTLKKTNTEEGIKEFIKRVISTGQYVCVEPKVDGFACSLHYKNGKLTMATVKVYKTTSHDITDLVLKMRNIPKVLKGTTDRSCVVRGEIYILKKDFTKLNEMRRKKGLPIFKHTVPAFVSMINSGVVSDKLRFFAFHMEPHGSIQTRRSLYLALGRMGFDISLYEHCQTFYLEDEIYFHISDIIARKAQLPVDIDGLVLKMDNLNSDIEPLGYKFPVEYHVVEVDGANPSKSGTTITFGKLKLEDGKEISKVIAENKTLPLNRGDKVRIGYISGTQPFLDTIIEHKPGEAQREYCLNCSKKLKPNSEGILQCFNWRCSSEKLRNLHKYCKAMGIKTKHNGASLITALYNRDLISRPSDLYRLIPEDLKDIPEHTVRLFFSEIANSKNKPLSIFVRGFKIGNIHPHTTSKICSDGKNLENLITRTPEDLKEMGLQPKSVKVFSRFLDSHKRELEYFASIGMGQKVDAKVDDIQKSFEEWKVERAEVLDLINLLVVKAGVFMTKTKNMHTALRSYQGKSAEIAAASRAQNGIRYILKYVLIFMKKLT